MKDKDFKEEVMNEGISFKSGTFIDCVLEIERKIDYLGNIYNSSYSVFKVLKRHTEGKAVETKQGMIYRRKKTLLLDRLGFSQLTKLGQINYSSANIGIVNSMAVN